MFSYQPKPTTKKKRQMFRNRSCVDYMHRPKKQTFHSLHKGTLYPETNICGPENSWLVQMKFPVGDFAYFQGRFG